MLFCPSLFAATLTTNTVPYVCQGGTSPQLCNSNITTDSNGNAAIGFGLSQTKNLGQVYQAATDGLVTVSSKFGSSGNTQLILFTDSNNPPTTEQGRIGQFAAGAIGINLMGFMRVKKNDYYEVVSVGNDYSNVIIYFGPIG